VVVEARFDGSLQDDSEQRKGEREVSLNEASNVPVRDDSQGSFRTFDEVRMQLLQSPVSGWTMF